MDAHNISETMLNNNCSDNTRNKVYINPYFNRAPGNNNHNSAALHVNPRFSHILSNIQPNTQNKGRIYVNPNFRKSANSTPGSLDSISTTNIHFIHQNTVTHYPHPHEQLKIVEEKTDLPLPIAQSRYSLVRQNMPKALESPMQMVENIKNTFQVSKYKSIPLNDIKRNLDNSKNAISRQPTVACNKTNNEASSNKKKSGSLAVNMNRNQFKLINNSHKNVGLVLKNDKIKMRTLIETHKKQSSQSRLKKIKGSLKKNNIPCPMFRKFGTCLRKIRGKCEFLHDKKHVSICRKYIKGLCHDKGCLLSHDLTTKKMPTCYFYLQGTCTKPDCPYLHVKLNEKVKICPDFLKGYCEKGSKCLLRHVSIQIEKKDKGLLVTKSSLTSKKKNTKVNVKKLDHNAEVTQSNENSAYKVKNENADYRYYQEQKEDDVNASETCEIIKPQRCKLGTLPSFIQL